MDLNALAVIPSSWRVRGTKKDSGAQIDLLFDCSDDSVILFEIKRSKEPYIISKALAKALHRKLDRLVEATGTTQTVTLALIAPFGLKEDMWSDDIVDRAVNLEDLFA